MQASGGSRHVRPAPHPPHGCARLSLVRKTLNGVLAEYGAVALVLYLVIFALVFAGVWFALRAGWTPASATGRLGSVAAAYVITKLTLPVRMAATVFLTPLVARVFERVRGKQPPA
jgi:hypothetical protein